MCLLLEVHRFVVFVYYSSFYAALGVVIARNPSK